jgi:hypothetical protein
MNFHSRLQKEMEGEKSEREKAVIKLMKLRWSQETIRKAVKATKSSSFEVLLDYCGKILASISSDDDDDDKENTPSPKPPQGMKKYRTLADLSETQGTSSRYAKRSLDNEDTERVEKKKKSTLGSIIQSQKDFRCELESTSGQSTSCYLSIRTVPSRSQSISNLSKIQKLASDDNRASLSLQKRSAEEPS